MIKLYRGDCLNVMKRIPDGSVDMVMADPPYGITVCKWDSIIPLEPMWEQLKRAIKRNGAIVMTASQPFTTTLISSNMKMFKYCWVWYKNAGGNFAAAKKLPIKYHEDVCVFYKKQPTYNPQRILRTSIGSVARCRNPVGKGIAARAHGTLKNVGNKQYDAATKGPETVLKIDCVPNSRGRLHPTQKPVALMEYLIKTYTNKGETVLDFCMGSGTTGVACKNLKRNFTGIEKDKSYYEIAKKRILNRD